MSNPIKIKGHDFTGDPYEMGCLNFNKYFPERKKDTSLIREKKQRGERENYQEENSETQSEENDFIVTDNSLEECKKHYIKLLADFENYKRRTDTEKKQLVGRGEEAVLRSILSFVEDMERAVREARNGGDLTRIFEGIDMVHKNLLAVLNKYGVDRIETVGKAFDPNLHEAAAVLQHSKYPDGSVVEEFRPGFTRAGKLLRAATVCVAQ